VTDIGVESVSDANYTLLARAWVERSDQPAVLFDLNRTIKEEFDRRAGPAAVERRAG
jgi:hypothetical protein